MILQPLKFTLTDNINSVTTLLSRAVHGSDAPDGFDEGRVVYKRSEKYYGVFKSFSIPLKFVKGQAYLVREHFYTYGFAGDMSVLVEKLNKVTLEYFTIYTGKLDFSTFKDNDEFCECNFTEGGLDSILKKNESTEVEISDTQYLENEDEDVIVKQYVIAPNVTSPPPSGVYLTALHPIEMGRMILDKITGQDPLNRTYEIKSDTLELIPTETEILITSGQAIRRFLAAPDTISSRENSIKTTFEDWFKTLDAIYCLGMQIEIIDGKETIVIESRDYFFVFGNYIQYINLGEVSKLVVSPYNEYNYGKLKGGWPEKDYNDEGRKYSEPCTTVQWKTGNLTTTKEYDFVAKYRGDQNGYLSILYSNYNDGSWNFALDPSDDSEDDQIFVFTVRNDENYNNKAEIFVIKNVALTKANDGLFLDSCFMFTPRKMLINHEDWLSDALFGFSAGNFEYSSGGNDEFYNIVSGVRESAALPIDATAKYYPLLFDFQAPYPNEIISMLEDPAYALPGHTNGLNSFIIFYLNKNPYYGWIISIEPKISDRSAAGFKLLCINSNITHLIR